jgi:hypothetical protein
MEVNETPQETQPVTTSPSRKQKFAIAALATGATILLQIVANVVVDQASSRIETAITTRKKNKSNQA